MIEEIKDKAEFLREIVNGSQGYVIYIRDNGDVGLLNASEKINNLLGVKGARFICDIKEKAQAKTDEPEKLDSEDKPEQKGKRKKIDQDLINQVVELYNSGVPQKDIAVITGISSGSVYNCLHRTRGESKI